MLTKFPTLNPQDQPSVETRAKAAALAALAGRNPALTLGMEEKEMVRLIVQGVIDGDIGRLEQEQRRLDHAAILAKQFLDTSELSADARAFLKTEFE
jgi:hypothetical protein